MSYEWSRPAHPSNQHRIEQAINFGLNQTKLNRTEVKRYWPKLTLDPARRAYIQQLLWPRPSSRLPKKRS